MSKTIFMERDGRLRYVVQSLGCVIGLQSLLEVSTWGIWGRVAACFGALVVGTIWTSLLFGWLNNIGVRRWWLYVAVALLVVSPAFIVPALVPTHNGIAVVPVLALPLQALLAFWKPKRP